MYITDPKKQAFTLVEIVVAAMILMITVSMAMMGLKFMMSEINQGDHQNELDVEIQIAMERIIRDLRLSTLEKIYVYPANAGTHTAISFPMARDDDGDGAIELDGDNMIIWDQTLVYHVWEGSPHQLRLTTFDPRNNSLNETERQEQIDSVVQYGSGLYTHNRSNVSTRVVFENLFNWSIEPEGSSYDGYASTLERDINTILGAAVLSNGLHTFEFRVAGTNDASTGYKIGIDNLFASPSYSTREGEAQLPVTAKSGPDPVVQYMTAGSWSGNYQLQFNATAEDQFFTLSLENDRWEETNFRSTGEQHEDTEVLFDPTLSPSDFIVQLEGMQTNWSASLQTSATNGISSSVNEVMGCAVRVLLRGEEMDEGSIITTSGSKCRVNLRAGAAPLLIQHAFIAEAADHVSPTMDTAASTTTRLTFSGNDSVGILGGNDVWSDYANFPIDKEKSYLVSYLVAPVAGGGTVWQWNETASVNGIGSFVIPATSAPAEADTVSSTWSARADVFTTNMLNGIQYLFTTYPTNGVYTSAIFDTTMTAPNYLTIDWSENLPIGSDIRIRTRSSTNEYMIGASSWSSITPITAPATINPGDYRYVQFQAQLTPPSSTLYSPKLQDITVRWEGEERLVDIGGTFTKGPDYGRFDLLVDGEPLIQGIVIDLEIYDYIRIHGGSNRITSALNSEITPRNTGR